jgi:hypothetical protein
MSKRKSHLDAELMVALRLELEQVERAIRTLERMDPRSRRLRVMPRKKLSSVARPGAD